VDVGRSLHEDKRAPSSFPRARQNPSSGFFLEGARALTLLGGTATPHARRLTSGSFTDLPRLFLFMSATPLMRTPDSVSPILGRTGLAIIAAASLASNAAAMTFDWQGISGSFDTTLSVGGIYRLDDPDREFYGLANGGQQYSVNADDGNLNYRKGWASQVIKGTHDLELKYNNFGAFVRGTYFYDIENEDSDRARTPLSDDALDRVGSGAQWLDMYVRGRFEVAGRSLDLRFGRQVLSLGESTFIPNGINVVNPVDVSRLRVPGSELREALLPVNMAKAALNLTDDLSLEAFWLLEFRRTEIDPAGSYFSSNDFATRGGRHVYLGFGALSDQQPLGGIPRDLDHEGNNYTQYGANLRLSVPALADTEFGLFFANYHSRLPVISAVTPTGPINTNLTGPLTQVFIRSGLDSTTAAAQAAGLWQLIVLSQTNPGALTPTQLATLQAAQTQAAIGGARQIALLTAAATGRYFIEYPENIRMLGLSFNTSLDSLGVAWQGEVSYKHGVPLQVDDVELLFATLSAVDTTGGTNFGANNQLGNYRGQYRVYVPGFKREDVWSAQTTMTKVFGPTLGAGQLLLLGEVGGIFVPGLPGKDTLRFDGAGTFTGGSQSFMNGAGFSTVPATPLEAFADDLSWGYQLVARLDYNNLFAGVNLSPSLAFVHDVRGNTPMPLGNFVEGRKSINLAAELTWQNAWSLEFRYVNFFGGGRYNLLADRDYVSTTIKYSF
jgi:hypothetical protein